MNPAWRQSNNGAKRERRLGAYLGAIGDVFPVRLYRIWRTISRKNDGLKVGATCTALYQLLDTRTCLSKRNKQKKAELMWMESCKNMAFNKKVIYVFGYNISNFMFHNLFKTKHGINTEPQVLNTIWTVNFISQATWIVHQKSHLRPLAKYVCELLTKALI